MAELKYPFMSSQLILTHKDRHFILVKDSKEEVLIHKYYPKFQIKKLDESQSIIWQYQIPGEKADGSDDMMLVKY